MAGIDIVNAESIEKEFTCSVCLEIFFKPSKLPCAHVFCTKCMESLADRDEGNCPLCREMFHVTGAAYDQDMDSRLRTSRGECQNCNLLMTLQQLSGHSITCRNRTREVPKFKPVAPTSQPAPSPGVNRSTFQCPYCSEQNLDSRSLTNHCNSAHKNTKVLQVVCPICASMPWGDPNMKSNNFLEHLNLRHRFDYDTYVDFQEDDDAMLRAAIMASMQQQ